MSSYLVAQRTYGLSVFCFVLLSLAWPLHAQTFVEQGAYQLHFNAFHSVDVDPEAIRLHKLQRAPNVGMLNISVIHVSPEGVRTPQRAKVTVDSNNLVGQIKQLAIKPVIEKDAIYYIAQFRFANDETFRFKVSATPESDPDTTLTTSFDQRFFTQ